MIAALYAVLTLFQGIVFPAFLTFGNVQLRVAEGLTLLPLVEAAAVPGLFIGCLITNMVLTAYSTFGWVDIVLGSLTTLVAAVLTRKVRSKFAGMLPPILLNAFVVSIWVSYYTNFPYVLCVLSIGLGEALAVFIFGPIFLEVYKRVMDKNRNGI